MPVLQRALTLGVLSTCAIGALLTARLHSTAMPGAITPPMMPVAFVGHGSPMSGIEVNQYSASWARLGGEFPRPRAILCVSAHWETKGTRVTSNARPKTIHDFYGFPKQLYDMEYPCPGSPELAKRVAELTGAQLDDGWGLDHGSWTLLTHMYPAADIPVVQLSLDTSKSPQEHMQLAQRLLPLREEGVLILGSGNVVHNLRTVDRSGLQGPAAWAKRVSDRVRSWILQRDFDSVAAYERHGADFQTAINSAEHFLPLLYVLGASSPRDEVKVVSHELQWGSLDMTSYVFNPQPVTVN